jgi:hypothetical protein
MALAVVSTGLQLLQQGIHNFVVYNTAFFFLEIPFFQTVSFVLSEGKPHQQVKVRIGCSPEILFSCKVFTPLPKHRGGAAFF